MGPFGTPWLTFSAWIVIGCSILLSILWAARSARGEKDDR